jgi:hypothetical protein
MHACVVHGVVVVVSTQQAPLLFRRDPMHLIALHATTLGRIQMSTVDVARKHIYG